VQAFGPDGARMFKFGARGIGAGEVIHPTGITVDCNNKVTVSDTDNNRVQTFDLTTLIPAASCTPLPAPAPPPALKYPTLPAPLGPMLTVKALRTSGLLAARNLPVRIGCDTTCKLTASMTLSQRATPAKGKKPVSIIVDLPAQTIPGGSSKVVRFPISVKDATKLRKALKGRRALEVALQLGATAAAGQPTEQTTRLPATA
jgi:hypothetical protein